MKRLTRKRTIVVLALVIVLVAVLLYAATPLLMLRDLRIALVARSPDAVAPMVDFPTLRTNAKDSAHRKIERKNDGAFLEPVQNWFDRHFTDEALDRIATPAGLIRLTCDRELDADLSKAKGKPCVLKGRVTHWRYLSWNRFRIDMIESDGSPLTLFLARRHWIEWRLVNVTGAGAGS